MNSDPTKPTVVVAPLHTFGWQRRADLDCSLGQVWESPDGKLQMFSHNTKPVMAILKPLRLKLGDKDANG
jgi:hypothetical protein